MAGRPPSELSWCWRGPEQRRFTRHIEDDGRNHHAKTDKRPHPRRTCCVSATIASSPRQFHGSTQAQRQLRFARLSMMIMTYHSRQRRPLPDRPQVHIVPLHDRDIRMPQCKRGEPRANLQFPDIPALLFFLVHFHCFDALVPLRAPGPRVRGWCGRCGGWLAKDDAGVSLWQFDIETVDFPAPES